jgi:hypothetical protein
MWWKTQTKDFSSSEVERDLDEWSTYDIKVIKS